jgi:hypothetical protein
MSHVQLFSSVAGVVPRAVACCFARRARAVCVLFVRDVLVVACCFTHRSRCRAVSRCCAVSRIVNLPGLESLKLIILLIYLIVVSVAD